jgi:hypothetical protein
MGSRIFASEKDRKKYHAEIDARNDREKALKEKRRREIAGKIVMILVDKIIIDIVRPGPQPEERECYEMAGEIRSLVSELENLVVKIINVNNGVE